MAMLKVHGIDVFYGNVQALFDVSIAVHEDEIVSIIGANGAGKTTLIHLLAGLQEPDEGQVFLLGRDLGEMKEEERTLFRRRHISLVLQEGALLPGLTVEENILLPMAMDTGRLVEEERLEQILEALGLTRLRRRFPARLSGGERQRVYIAMALAQDTKVIFLDEPTTYLDLRHQFELLELLEMLKQRGKTILFVLHDLAHALRYSDRIVLMEGGKLAGQGTPAQILESGMLDAVFGICTHAAPDGYWFTPQHGDAGRF